MFKSAICMPVQVPIYYYREGSPKPKYVFNRVPFSGRWVEVLNL